MKVEVEELGACKRRLQVEETPEVVRVAWEQAFSRVQKQAKLPGFRKGKVPRSMIKIHFADDVRQEVARHLIPDVYRQALAETQIKPVEDPDLQEVRLEEDAPLVFSAVVEIKPDIALGAYTGLAVSHTPTPLTDDEVEEAIGQIREQHAEYRAVERAADIGDLVIVDYTLTPEDMEPRSESGYGFVIGQSQVMKEIDEAVIGLVPGGTRETRLRFADDHRSEALRGKSGAATVTLREVKEKILPALDDEFAKTVGAFETLDALRAEVRKELEARRERDNRQALEEKIVEALLAAHEFQVPDALVMRQVGHTVEHARERVRRQGVDPDKLPWDYQKLVADLRPGAEKAVRRTLLLEAIAEKESLAPGEADVDAEVEKIAQASQRPAPAVRSMMEQSGDLDGLRFSLRERRTMDFLIERAQVTA
jgi:trigger factor